MCVIVRQDQAKHPRPAVLSQTGNMPSSPGGAAATGLSGPKYRVIAIQAITMFWAAKKYRWWLEVLQRPHMLHRTPAARQESSSMRTVSGNRCTQPEGPTGRLRLPLEPRPLYTWRSQWRLPWNISHNYTGHNYMSLPWNVMSAMTDSSMLAITGMRGATDMQDTTEILAKARIAGGRQLLTCFRAE